MEVAKFTPAEKKTRQVRSNVKSMLIFHFSTSKALSTRNSYPPGQTVNGSFTARVWSSWGRALGADVQTSGRTIIGFSSMTTRPLTHHPTIPDFQKYYIPLFAWPRPLRFFPTPQDEITAERASFWRDGLGPRRFARCYWHTHIWEIPGMHEILRKKLGSLYTCPRGLLRRRQWKLELW